MANFYGHARSNYFKVRDAVKFEEMIESLPSLRFWQKDGRYVIYSDCPDSGRWPSSQWDDETDDYVDVDLESLVAEHLADGEVAVMMQCGAEKLRYLSGYAVAFDNTGRSVCVRMSDIYALATEKFGITPTAAEY